MQPELMSKKKEIISVFLKNGALISPDLLSEINDYEQASQIFDFIKDRKFDDTAVIDSNIKKIISKKQEKSASSKKSSMEKVKIITNYKDEPKKREPLDFVNYLINRYKGIEKVLKQHAELAGTVSIGRLSNKKDKENVSIIGIVSDKQTTKNGNLMITVEDPTGRKKVIVNKNKPDLFKEAQDIVNDEVIGITGVNLDTVIFANNIIWPDVPSSKELKKAPQDIQDKYAIFLSDLHVGSSKFLPDDFEKFLRWINCEMGSDQQKIIARNVEYIFIAGDLVDGVGIYPEQDKELEIKDIYDQYTECARLLKQIPSHIPLIICPGNHDAMRLSEPQPCLSKEYAKPLWEIPNVIMVTNPSTVNIDADENFEGFDVLMYHGYSFDYYVANVDSLRNQGGYDRADLIMKFLLKRRHVAPAHLSTLYIPDVKSDPLIIEKVPDFFLSGHIHKTAMANYRNTTLICGSCWQGKTAFQEKVGHHPEPSRVPIVNLRTREVKIMRFGQ
jgi:DNA polymerase II small subunit